MRNLLIIFFLFLPPVALAGSLTTRAHRNVATRSPPLAFTGRAFINAFLKTCLTIAAVLPWTVPAARAHQAPTGWSYPISCCSGFDCRSVQGASVKERPEGYVVPSGEVLAMTDRRIRYSPDGEFHLCTIGGTDAGRTICLFVPPRSF